MHNKIMHLHRLTKRWLFSLDEGLYLHGSITPMDSILGGSLDNVLLYPTVFEEHVAPLEEREKQWQRIKATGEANRTVTVFASRGDRCLWGDDFVRKFRHNLSGGYYRNRYGHGMLVESITYEDEYANVKLGFTEVRDPRGISFPVDDPQLIRVLQQAAFGLIYVPQGVEYVVEDDYGLIGYYWEGDKRYNPNVEIFDTSQMYQDLERVKQAIEEINRIMHEGSYSWDEPPQSVQDIIERALPHIDIYDHNKGYMRQINILGIYKLRAPVKKVDT